MFEPTKRSVTIAEQSADTILALINSQPTTPSKAEIARIITAAASGHTAISRAGHAELKRWDQSVRKHLADLKAADTLDEITLEEEQGLADQIHADAEAIWSRPIRGWEDLVVRTAMVVYWNSEDRHIAYPDCVIARGGKYCMDERAFAFLVRGILDLAGLKFDAEGRLL
jgi:hypothetical protein